MSHPGLLHHFPTKQALLEAVLTAHEEADQRAFVEHHTPTTVAELADVMAAAVAVDSQERELVRLRARLGAAAADPRHRAHDFAVRRYERLAAQTTQTIAALSAGEVPPDLPAEEAAAILLATIEGLLIRGLTDPALDVPALVRLAVLRIFGR